MAEPAPIGHNNPPSMIEAADYTANDISAWLAENVVIETSEQALDAKLMLDRGKLCKADLDAERRKLVDPLNQEVKQINDRYRPPDTLLDKVINEIKVRGNAYLKREEDKRKAAAAEAARIAAEKEAAAREAERLEKEAFQDANSGELGINIVAASREADSRFTEYQKAQRAADRAEKETHVKFGGGFTRAASLRQQETLVVTDAVRALQAIGASEKIKEAIIKSARAYRKVYDELPPGVEAQVERTI